MVGLKAPARRCSVAVRHGLYSLSGGVSGRRLHADCAGHTQAHQNLVVLRRIDAVQVASARDQHYERDYYRRRANFTQPRTLTNLVGLRPLITLIGPDCGVDDLRSDCGIFRFQGFSSRAQHRLGSVSIDAFSKGPT